MSSRSCSPSPALPHRPCSNNPAQDGEPTGLSFACGFYENLGRPRPGSDVLETYREFHLLRKAS